MALMMCVTIYGTFLHILEASFLFLGVFTRNLLIGSVQRNIFSHSVLLEMPNLGFEPRLLTQGLLTYNMT